MSRLLVEGRARLPWAVPFADVVAAVPQPTIVQPQPATGTISGPAPNMSQLNNFMGPTSIFNPDSVAHTFRSFLRGPGAPAGSIELTAPGITPSSLSVAAGAVLELFPDELGPNLMHDQIRLEFEMQEAIVTPGAVPVLTAYYEVLLAQLLTVKGRRFGMQLGVMNPASPSILGCPADARSRTVINFAPDANVPEGLAIGSWFRNRDSNPAAPPPADKTLSFTLTDPVLGSLLLLSEVAPQGGEAARVPAVDILPGQTLTASVAEPTTTTDPLIYWVFVDNI